MYYRMLIFALSLALLLSACGGLPGAGNGGAPAVAVNRPTATTGPDPASEGGVEPAEPATFTPQPSFTPWPTETPTAPPTETPVPTATPHPMMIEAQRQMAYPGSEITLESELDPGDNYRRYYAYYLSEGLKIYALLTVPNGEPPPGGWPAIVFNHGYIAPNVYRTTERYVAYVDGLARSGYVVFRIDYRGHDRSEGEATGAYGSPDYTTDVLNAVASIRQYPQVNPEKIGMWGHSMGGYLTLRSMVISPDVKVGVIWAGVVGSYPDLMTRWRRATPPPSVPPSGRRWRDAWVREFGTPEENPDFWNSVSANTYLSEISGPVQLHHGTADESVPLVFSEILNEQLQAAGKAVELHTYEGDNHNISGYFSMAMARTVAFFDRYLK